MNRKLVWGTVLFLNLCLLAFTSCSDDSENDPAKPSVNLKELGSGHDSPDDKVAYIGMDAHIEAEIVAEGLIRQIEVEVHQKNGNYRFNKTYTDEKYVGKQNTIFHEHFEIPSDAVVGEYHFHLTVTDQLGQTSTIEAELIIEAALTII